MIIHAFEDENAIHEHTEPIVNVFGTFHTENVCSGPQTQKKEKRWKDVSKSLKNDQSRVSMLVEISEVLNASKSAVKAVKRLLKTVEVLAVMLGDVG